MDFETLVRSEEGWLTRQLSSALGGDTHAAEDLRQEAFLRAWRSLPRDLDPHRQRAWLRRTAANLAVDELRRRGRRPAAALDAAGEIAAATAAQEPDAAREALASLRPNERLLLLLRFSGGLRHAEIARLFDSSEEAIRKRVGRARRSFLMAYRAARREQAPLVLVVARNESPAPYVRWLENAGARVRIAPEQPRERDLVLSDALVFTGAFTDVHSGLYGERPRALRGDPDLEADRVDLALVHAAVALDVPMVGICRGHQLLNIASGGTLYQDIVLDGLTDASHDEGKHRVDTDGTSATRRLVGRSVEVESGHHQAVRRLGRHLRPTASSSDGVIEMIERQDRRFMLGLQWHPENNGELGDTVAQALVEGGSVSAPVTIRPARLHDAPALARLAQLDSAAAPREPVLVAEAADEIVAAISLADRAIIANPFRPTTDIVELLIARERQLRDSRGWRLRRALRRRLRPAAARA